MSVHPMPPVQLVPSAAQELHARSILSHPEDYAHRPQAFSLAWAVLKAQRGETLLQHRLKQGYLIERDTGGEAA